MIISPGVSLDICGSDNLGSRKFSGALIYLSMYLPIDII